MIRDVLAIKLANPLVDEQSVMRTTLAARAPGNSSPKYELSFA